MDEDELKQIMCLGTRGLEFFLQPANFDDLYQGYKESGLDLLNFIKSKLYPGYKEDMIINIVVEAPQSESEESLQLLPVKISQLWQEKVFLGLSLNQIFEILTINYYSTGSNLGILEAIQKIECIRAYLDALIIGWLDGQLSPFDFLLNPEYEEFLIGSYMGGQQTLAAHIRSKLYPDGLSFLIDAGAGISKEAQAEILDLISLEKILQIASGHLKVQEPISDIREFMQRRKLLNDLRDKVISKHKNKLQRILARLRNLNGLLLPVNQFWNTYKGLFRLISLEILPISIVYNESSEATNNWMDVFTLYSPHFFPLEQIGEEINSGIQQEIFMLLFKDNHNLAAFLVQLGYLWQREHDIKGFITLKKTTTKLRDMMVSFHWKKLIKLLVKIPG